MGQPRAKEYNLDQEHVPVILPACDLDLPAEVTITQTLTVQLNGPPSWTFGFKGSFRSEHRVEVGGT